MKPSTMTERVLLLFVLLVYLSFSDAILRYVDGVSGTTDGSNGYYKTIQTGMFCSLFKIIFILSIRSYIITIFYHKLPLIVFSTDEQFEWSC